MTVGCLVSRSVDKTVNIQDLGKQLKREITLHPKKAVVLGIVLLLMLYFWIPLLWEWNNKSKELPNGTQTAANTSPGPTNSTNNLSINSLSANKENKPLRYCWKEIVKWMDNDPRTRPAEPLTINRDPFQSPKEMAEKADKIALEEQAKAKAPPVTPASLGMALTSTIIGAKGGLARIGGRTYNQGQTIEMEKEGRNYKFVLLEIHDRRVVLEKEGEHFELSIPEPGTSGRMVLGTAGK
jgi:hypothetical protein